MNSLQYDMLADRQREVIQRIRRIELRVADLTRQIAAREWPNKPTGPGDDGFDGAESALGPSGGGTAPKLAARREKTEHSADQDQARINLQISSHGRRVQQTVREKRAFRKYRRRDGRTVYGRRGVRGGIARTLGQLIRRKGTPG